MAMATGQRGVLKSDINITPLVDVVLVLLIIFMVITPIAQVGYEARVPPKLEDNVPPPPSVDQVIVRLDAAGRIFINKEEVSEQDFPRRLRDVLRGRENKVSFFAASGDLDYDRVIHFLNVCHENGLNNLGIVLEELS